MRPRPRAAPGPLASPIELVIASVGAHGDGVAPGPIYVAGALPGERVLARVDGDRGWLERVLDPSPERVIAPCPHFGDCGGCALQHWEAPAYRAWKVGQVRQALARVGIETEILPAFVVPPGARRRLALHARARPGGGVDIGFKARRSWRLAPIAVCPVASPRLVAAFDALRAIAGPLFEHRKSAPILHATTTETGIDVEITGVERRAGALSADARAQVAAAAAGGDLARVTLEGEILYQARAPVVRVGRASLALPPGAFLQAAPEAEAAMADFIADAVAPARALADLYCGVGAFALRLAESHPVSAADVSAQAVGALAAARATAPGLKAIAAEARDLARRPLGPTELRRFEAVVIDPPRAGAVEQHRALAASQVPIVASVSCNPATFARDAEILTEGGFTLARVLPVDQFLWSAHIELVGVFERRGG